MLPLSDCTTGEDCRLFGLPSIGGFGNVDVDCMSLFGNPALPPPRPPPSHPLMLPSTPPPIIAACGCAKSLFDLLCNGGFLLLLLISFVSEDVVIPRRRFLSLCMSAAIGLNCCCCWSLESLLLAALPDVLADPVETFFRKEVSVVVGSSADLLLCCDRCECPLSARFFSSSTLALPNERFEVSPSTKLSSPSLISAISSPSCSCTE